MPGAPVDAILARGTLLHYSTDGGTVYSELVDMKEIGSPGDPEAMEVDVTPLNPYTGSREFLLGLRKSGTIMFKQWYNKMRFAALRGMLGTRNDWKFTFPDGATPVASSVLTFKGQIGRASCRKECRYRWSPTQDTKKQNENEQHETLST